MIWSPNKAAQVLHTELKGYVPILPVSVMAKHLLMAYRAGRQAKEDADDGYYVFHLPSFRIRVLILVVIAVLAVLTIWS